MIDLPEHPRPWKIQIVGVSALVLDALGDTVTGFEESDELWPFIVQEVNANRVKTEPVSWQRRFKDSSSGQWFDWGFSRLSFEEFNFRFGDLIQKDECQVRHLYAAAKP